MLHAYPEGVQIITKLYMDLFLQAQAQTKAPGEQPEASDRPLKARIPNSYYENSHMECYSFRQECEDYFDTAGAKGHSADILQPRSFAGGSIFAGNSTNIESKKHTFFQKKPHLVICSATARTTSPIFLIV